LGGFGKDHCSRDASKVPNGAKNRAVSFKELAFDLTGGKVLVWAVVSDNDDTSEKNLILSEAKVNAHFTDSIFRLSSTIVEEGDQLPIPNQYLLFSKA
jgi:hypothetical protein